MTTTNAEVPGRSMVVPATWILGVLCTISLAAMIGMFGWLRELDSRIDRLPKEAPPEWFQKQVDKNTVDVSKLLRDQLIHRAEHSARGWSASREPNQ